MARRSDHTGTIIRRLDGSWQGSLMVSGRRRYVHGKTEAEAWQRLMAMRAVTTDASGQPVVPRQTTFADWSEESLFHRAQRLRATTLNSYPRRLRLLAATEGLGGTQLAEISPTQPVRVFQQVGTRHRPGVHRLGDVAALPG